MTDLIYALYDECLEAGMLPEQFWNCTHYDIVAYLKAHNKALKYEMKRNSKMLFNIGILVGHTVNGKTIEYKKLFPNLFDPKEDEQPAQTWQQQKQIMLLKARQYNEKKRREREALNDTGRT